MISITRVKSPKCELDCVSDLETFTDEFGKLLENEDENIPPRIMEALRSMHENLANIYADLDSEVSTLEGNLDEANARIESLESESEGGEQA